MSSKKTLALIGAGHWGKNLARNFYELQVLHTICDANQSLLTAFAELYPEVELTAQFDAVLHNPSITCIAIAAPAALHFTLAKQALLSGKDVYVEKPLCLSIKEAEELILLADQQERILMVGHLLQYHPVVACLQKMVKEGIFGKLQYIASHRLSLGQIRTEENNLWSFAPHDISVILSLLENSLPEAVRCIGQDYISEGIPDMTWTNLQFANKIRAHIYTSWLHPFKEQKLVVVGTDAMAVFDDTLPWSDKLILHPSPISWKNGMIPQVNKTAGTKISVEQKEPLKEECTHFIACCEGRHKPKTDGKEGLRVLQVLQAAQSSLESGGDARCLHQKVKNYFAHPTAIVDKGASVGKETKIWHFSHIMDKAILGNSCNIGQNVVVSPQVVLGNNVKIQNNVSVYSGVRCEDNVFLGPSMVFTNVINPRSGVNRRGEYEETIVRQGASIGANATIVCGVELGAYSFIGAGAVVTKDVKPFALMVGNPARQIGWMSRYGEKLDLPLSAGNDQVMRTACPTTGEIYVLKGNTLQLELNQEQFSAR